MSAGTDSSFMRSRYTVALAVVGFVTLVLLLVPAAALTPNEYTGWATAVQAFGTVMAFAAAAAAFIWQWNQTRQPDRQARAVTTWLVQGPRGIDDDGRLKLIVRNGSDLPITDVLVNFIDGREMGNAPLVQDLGVHEFRKVFDVVPPMTSVRFLIDNPGGAMGFQPSSQVCFTDANDRHWVRTARSAPMRVPDTEWANLNAQFGWSWGGVLEHDTFDD